MPFQHFFQGLCIIGMARTVLGSAIGGALYGYLMRYNMTDQTSILSSAIDPAAMASIPADLYGIYGDMMQQALMMSVKNLFGSFDYRGFQR